MRPPRCSSSPCVVGTEMADDDPKRASPTEADVTQEIRETRKFSLAEAIGRLAGPGVMKGESPASRVQQAEAAIENHLNEHLVGRAGEMSVVLQRQVKGSELLL